MLAQATTQPDEAIAAFARGATDEAPPALADAFLIGTPDEIEARIRTYLHRGISHFLLWFMDAPDQAGLQLFAQEVIPRFR
jgi:alkanesulfonate monooxygenase SsuD/methylene tetrahydromethanopterin reductase-like flavin-dependent oxidoreductase (luciferase family)